MKFKNRNRYGGFPGLHVPGLHLLEFNRDDDPDPENEPSGAAGSKGQPDEEPKPEADPKPDPKPAPKADDDRVKALEAKLERERKEREKLEKEKQEREDAKKTELERAQERLKLESEKRAAAEKRVQDMQRDAALRDAALEAGVRQERLGAVLRIVDNSKVSFDEEGNPVGVKAAIEDAKTEFPEFFGGGSKATANPGTGGGKSPDKGDPEEPETDYDIGRAIARGTQRKKNRI